MSSINSNENFVSFKNSFFSLKNFYWFLKYQNLEEKLKKQMANGFKWYWIAIGKNDVPILYNAVQDYRAKLDSMGMKYEYLETEGGHTWTNWRDYLTTFSQRLFK